MQVLFLLFTLAAASVSANSIVCDEGWTRIKSNIEAKSNQIILERSMSELLSDEIDMYSSSIYLKTKNPFDENNIQGGFNISCAPDVYYEGFDLEEVTRGSYWNSGDKKDGFFKIDSTNEKVNYYRYFSKLRSKTDIEREIIPFDIVEAYRNKDASFDEYFKYDWQFTLLHELAHTRGNISEDKIRLFLKDSGFGKFDFSARRQFEEALSDVSASIYLIKNGIVEYPKLFLSGLIMGRVGDLVRYDGPFYSNSMVGDIEHNTVFGLIPLYHIVKHAPKVIMDVRDSDIHRLAFGIIRWNVKNNTAAIIDKGELKGKLSDFDRDGDGEKKVEEIMYMRKIISDINKTGKNFTRAFL